MSCALRPDVSRRHTHVQRGFGGVPGQAQDDELALVHVDGARVPQVRRAEAAVEHAVQVDPAEALRAGALR